MSHKHPWYTESSGALNCSLVDFGVRFGRSPGEPEVIGVDDGGQILACYRSLYGLSQDIQNAAWLVVHDQVTVGVEGKLPAVQVGVEHAGSCNIGVS